MSVTDVGGQVTLVEIVVCQDLEVTAEGVLLWLGGQDTADLGHVAEAMGADHVSKFNDSKA